MNSLWKDVRFGARALAKSPGFALVAVVSLAVGIGANTTIFSLVNAALLRPLPQVRDESRLVDVNRTRPDGDSFAQTSYPDYLFFRDNTRDVFEGLALHSYTPLDFASGGEPERVRGLMVSANYFDVLGVTPARGRFFVSEEDAAGSAPTVAVVSYKLWQRRFAGGEAEGRQVILNGRPFTVVGVAPEGFKSPYVYLEPDVYVPVAAQPLAMPGRDLLSDRSAGWFGVRGRLKEGVTADEARAALNVLASRLQAEFPEEEAGQGAAVHAVGHVPGEVRTAVVGFMATLGVVVGLVLLVACANVAGMQLARASARRREVAIRSALGATRGRVVRQLLTESVMLFLVGGALGVLLAVWMNDLLMAFRPEGTLKVEFDIDVDWRVLSYTLGVSLLTGVVFGLAPALAASKTDVIPALKDSTPSGAPRSSRLRGAFVVGQIAISLVLLVAAALCVQSLRGAAAIDPGFDPAGVGLASVDLRLQGYDEARGREFFRRLKERAASQQGVESAALAQSVQLSGLMFGRQIRVEGHEPAPGEPPLRVMSNTVDEDYFGALRVPLLAGRGFGAGDAEGSRRVAVINRTMAERYFGGQAAVGKRFTLLASPNAPGGTGEETSVEVVGVVGDGRYYTLGEEQRPFMYLPFAQNYGGMMTLHVRARGGEIAQALAAVRREAQALDPNMPLVNVMPMEQAVGFSLIPLRLAATVVGGLGLFGLLLAALGVFGVVSYTVGGRTREIGVRVALGARPRDVLRLVMRQGVWMALAGVGVGVAGALALTRFLSSLLYGVSATDPLAFGAVALLLSAVALLACYVPARRATKVDPMVALRHE